MKQQSKFKRVFLRVLLVLLLLVIGAMIFLLLGQNKIKKMDIADVTISDIKDGVYIGRFEGYRWSNEVQVTIQGGKIASLDLLKDQMVQIPEVTDEIFSRVMKEQSLQVDTVTSATITCKAYLKGIENALKQ